MPTFLTPLTELPSYTEGRHAFYKGKARDDCPYDGRTRDGRAWDAGYMQEIHAQKNRT